MTGIVAGGTGFIGQYLIQRWLQQGRKIRVIGRSRKKINHVFFGQVEAITWAELKEKGNALLKEADFVLNLAGANVGNKRWDKERKKYILQSRTETTATISDICAALGDKSPPLLNASAIGIYGQQVNEQALPERFTEATDIDTHPAEDFLSTVAHAWEKSTAVAKAHGVRVVNLRFGVVLGQSGGALEQLVRPFKLGVGGTMGKGTQPFSWIHLADVANAIEFILQHEDLRGPVNLVAPGCVMQKQFAKALAKTLKRPCFMSMPSILVKILLGTEMANELVLYGQHVYPQQLLDAGFQFQYPDIDAALQNIYQKQEKHMANHA